MRRAVVGVDPDVTISSQQMEHQLDGCDPLACVLYSHSPSVQVYYALRSRLESSSEPWLQEFVSLDGLDSLLDSLGHMTGPKFSGFSDAILQIDCLSCIRIVLNSRTGMETMVKSHDGVWKLLKGVDLANTLPRKHVIEILSAVCVYSSLGYRKLLEAFDRHRRENHLYHRFSFIVNELKMAETVPHKTSVLTLINAIICGTPDCGKRCRIRNEFIGLSLLDVLSFLQREDRDEDLYVQLQVFLEKKHSDEELRDLESSHDLSSPQDLTEAIQARVFGGPRMVSFVNILQDLLAIEYLEKEKSDTIWQVLERHVNHIVHGTRDITSLSTMETETACQAVSLAVDSNPDVPTFGTKARMRNPPDKDSDGQRATEGKGFRINRQTSSSCIKRDGVVLKTSADSGYIGYEEKVSPPGGCTRNQHASSGHSSSAAHDKTNCPHYSDDSSSCNQCSKADINYPKETYMTDVWGKDSNMNAGKGRQVSMYDNLSPVKGPPPKKMATDTCDRDKLLKNNLNTVELRQDEKMSVPSVKNIPCRTNLALNIADLQRKQDCGDKNDGYSPHGHNYLNYQRNRLAFPAHIMRNLKWIKLDEATVEKYPRSIWANADVGKAKVQPDFQQVEEMFRETSVCDETTETPLLRNKTRLSLNLFLNRLEEEPMELVKRLANIDEPGLPLPFIKHLVEILPENDEIRHLKFYNGSLLDLGQAEQFVLHLSDLPDYRTLLTGHLRRAEFSVTAGHLHSVLDSMLESSRVVLSHEGLQEIFLLILRLGNFLNHGQYNGYAGGYKLTSLTRLTDVKSREPGHNFVHFMIGLADTADDQLLGFLSEIPRLEKAASCSAADIKAEFDKMNNQINSFVRQMGDADPVIREAFNGFLEEVKREFRELQNQITELKTQSQKLAEYFCESESFDIQVCFRLILEFLKQLRLCRQEFQLMKKQKNMAARHSGMFSQQIRNKNIALQFGQDAGASSSIREEKRQIVELLLTELHRGNFGLSALPSSGKCQPLPPSSNKNEQEVSRKTPDRTLLPNSGTTTPDRELNPMEISHISLMGTPMMNRPCSELLDEELTITALNVGPRMVTSSVSHLPDGTVPPGGSIVKPPPVLAIKNPLARTVSNRTKRHHRSRSDLADSINTTTKWIKYHQQARFESVQAPLARPESSMTLATLNLEAGMRRGPHLQSVALVSGPTVELPAADNAEEESDTGSGEFVRFGKKGERKSGALSNFFNKISKKVLRQRSSSDQNAGEKVDGNNEAGGEIEKHANKAATSTARMSGKQVTKSSNHKQKADDKENIYSLDNPFDRQKKNPIRLSNRFKAKLNK